MLWNVRILGPGISVSLLPLLLLIFAFLVSAEQDTPARSGYGPFSFDGPHCHRGDALDPPRQGVVRHTHNDFHSGFERGSEYHKKYESYFKNYPDDVFFSSAGDKGVSSFRHGWKPPGQPNWHNHGDDDTFWWEPDEENNNSCHFTPEFYQDSYEFEVNEDVQVGTAVGQPVQSFDEDGDQPTHTLEGPDRNAFTIDSVTGQIETKAALDYETRSSYSLRVKATDPAGRNASVPVTITVNDMEEDGQVTVFGAPEVGRTVTARLTDPDGDVSGVTWVWQVASSDSSPWEAINGATGNQYTVTTDEYGKYVRATAGYTDRRGSGKSRESNPVLIRQRSRSPAPVQPNEGETPTPTPTPTPHTHTHTHTNAHGHGHAYEHAPHQRLRPLPRPRPHQHQHQHQRLRPLPRPHERLRTHPRRLRCPCPWPCQHQRQHLRPPLRQRELQRLRRVRHLLPRPRPP